MAKAKKPRLGRGLSSLMAEPAPVTPQEPSEPTSARPEGEAGRPDVHTPEAGGESERAGVADGGLTWLDVGAIEPNPFQPRRGFDEEALEQLAQSIRQDGVMQPIVVRRTEDGERYQLVAGERRWRAAQRAELERIPAILHTLDDRKLAEWAVIENLQREDLNPVERAEAFARLIEKFELSHQDVAERVGVNRSTITNVIRLLDLHPDVREWVRIGKLSAGHGRALLGVDDPEAQLALAKRAVSGGWSVRTVEETVRRATQAAGGESKKKAAGTKSAHLADLQEQIGTQLQTKVNIKPGRKKNSGTLAIEFYDLDQFDALLEKLGVEME